MTALKYCTVTLWDGFVGFPQSLAFNILFFVGECIDLSYFELHIKMFPDIDCAVERVYL